MYAIGADAYEFETPPGSTDSLLGATMGFFVCTSLYTYNIQLFAIKNWRISSCNHAVHKGRRVRFRSEDLWPGKQDAVRDQRTVLRECKSIWWFVWGARIR